MREDAAEGCGGRSIAHPNAAVDALSWGEVLLQGKATGLRAVREDAAEGCGGRASEEQKLYLTVIYDYPVVMFHTG